MTVIANHRISALRGGTAAAANIFHPLPTIFQHVHPNRSIDFTNMYIALNVFFFTQFQSEKSEFQRFCIGPYSMNQFY